MAWLGPQGAGLGPAGTFNRLVAAPGQEIALGTGGGVLLLGPPGGAPGEMTFEQMQNKIWHLLREDGPYTGYPAPTQGDYAQSVLQADLNIALAQFISDTGLAPSLTDRQDTFNVFPVLDQPVPPGLVSLYRIEYTPQGQQTYVLLPKSMTEFDQITGGWLPNDVGQPYYYRQPWAGYVRLTPQPGLGNALGAGTGAITIAGVPAAGQVVTAYLFSPGSPTVVVSYVVTEYDTLATIAFNLAQLINTSDAVVGPTPFLAAPSTTGNVINLTSLFSPGTSITYYVTATSGVVSVLGTEGGIGIGTEGGSYIGLEGGSFSGTTTLNVFPNTATNLAATGDTMTWYYSTYGTFMIYPNDTPGIPPPFHIALVYRVLGDYWDRKQDPAQAANYMKKYAAAVAKGKTFVYDSDRATQPTLAGDLDDSYIIGGW